MNQALQGYRILDFTKLLPGPLATLWMAQQGAEVIKVESPSSPDPVRFYPPMKDGVSVFYSTLNAGKKSLSIDYRSEEGKEAILKLVETADVVIEQFRPGVMDAFGLGYATLKKRNPKIILVAITGYGQTGEMAATPGHDINYLSYSGMLDAQRDKSGNPIISAAQLADVAGGSMMALNATTSALLHRERTGEGQHVDVSMTHNVSVLQTMRIAEELKTGTSNGYLSGRLASYNIYKCSDGRHVALGALEPKFWQKFCNLMDHAEWGGRLMEVELIDEVAAQFATQSMQFWVDKLEKEDVCLSPVLTVQEAAAHPLFRNGFPTSFGSVELSRAPKLGADNEALLN
ncbi:MAG: CoA transferase [Flavobacteriales bacterium]|nr:CoA transferase [Flavobacteriales bacterium]